MKKSILLGSISCLALLSAFDNTTPGWKMEADGKMALKDGNPIYINSSGQEQTVEAGTITRLNGEAKEFRIAKEAAETKLEQFKDITDPVAAKKAIETLAKIDQKKLIDAGEVDRVKDEIKAGFTAQLTEAQTALADRDKKINNMLVSDVFKSSEFVRDGIAVPRDMFESTFRDNFKIEDGKITAYDKAGNKLMSKTRAGEYANPEEALQLLVDSHPQKEVILKAQTGSGTGSTGGGGNRGNARTMKRTDYDALPALQKSEAAAKMGKGEITIVD